MILKTLANLRRAQSFLEQLSAEGGVAELHVSLYARDDFRIELPPDCLSRLARLHLVIALDVHPHLPLETPAARSN